MSVTVERKDALIKEYGAREGDTGSPEVQVAILTERIDNLIDNFKNQNKYNHTRRGMLNLVALRRKLLEFVSGKDVARYKTLNTRLNFRR
jgi:small subunit ribosomal protein S15